jgi:excisionase family DNA binding protein
MPDPSPDRLLTLNEAAAVVHVHPKTLQNLAQRGAVRAATKWGGQWRFNRDLLLHPPCETDTPPVARRKPGRPIGARDKKPRRKPVT